MDVAHRKLTLKSSLVASAQSSKPVDSNKIQNWDDLLKNLKKIKLCSKLESVSKEELEKAKQASFRKVLAQKKLKRVSPSPQKKLQRVSLSPQKKLKIYEVENGMVGMMRDIILRLLKICDSDYKTRVIIGMCNQHYFWKNNLFLKREKKACKLNIKHKYGMINSFSVLAVKMERSIFEISFCPFSESLGRLEKTTVTVGIVEGDIFSKRKPFEFLVSLTIAAGPHTAGNRRRYSDKSDDMRFEFGSTRLSIGGETHALADCISPCPSAPSFIDKNYYAFSMEYSFATHVFSVWDFDWGFEVTDIPDKKGLYFAARAGDGSTLDGFRWVALQNRPVVTKEEKKREKKRKRLHVVKFHFQEREPNDYWNDDDDYEDEE